MGKMLTRDRSFYKRFFGLMGFLVFQNLIVYSVNVADNIMLGSYSQNALSGAAAVNQIQFVLQQITLGIGEGLVVLASQYWGQRKLSPIRKLILIALEIGIFLGMLLTVAVSIAPNQIMGIFTDDRQIVAQGIQYLSIMRFTYVIFMITQVLLAALRSMEVVKIGFYISITTLLINIGINYTLIYGNFGMPRLGIVGAAIGTLTARCIELLIILYFCFIKDKTFWKDKGSAKKGETFGKNGVWKKREMFAGNRPKFVFFALRKPDRGLLKDYVKVSLPVIAAQTLFGISVGMQTVVLGHLTADAIAANSVATTLFQYLKIIAIGAASATSILIGKAVGEGNLSKIKEYSKTLQCIYVLIGLTISACLLLLKGPLLSLYALTPKALKLADQILILLSITCIGTSYQMPTLGGIVRGGGDTKFILKMDLISIWVIMYPLSFLAAFYWKLPTIAVVAFLNSDQVFKCIPAVMKVNKYNWIKKLTKT
ncbi:polysaccharide biosynthesis C-terminal domain-containing protein [Lachnospiraceae bacterium ZAX-1]